MLIVFTGTGTLELLQYVGRLAAYMYLLTSLDALVSVL